MSMRILPLSTLFLLVSSQTNPAPIVTDNQYGIAYSVALTQGPGPLVGTFDFKALNRGVGVAFNMNGFNASDETNYTYHIHEKPVPSNGDCNATGDHFDPYRVGVTHQCDPSQPNLCQLGDLSGKHGLIQVSQSKSVASAAYQDEFLSTNMGDIAFFANLSIVVHQKRDSYRLNCGNFTLYGSPVAGNGSTNTPSNMSTILYPGSSTSSHLNATSSASLPLNYTGTPNMTAPAMGSATAHQSSAAISKTSSDFSMRTGNQADRHFEASLVMLGVAAAIAITFL